MIMQMSLEIITSEAAFAALEPVWDGLLEESATHSPFQAWDYVRLWWQHFRDEYQLNIGVVRDELGKALGIAPWVIGPDRGESRRYLRHLGFMNGLGDVQGERLDLIVPAGREAEISPLLVSLIQQSSSRWDVVRLNKVPEDSPNHAILLAEMAQVGAGAQVLCQSSCRCFDLPPTWEEFEKGKSANFRRNLRRHWGNLNEKHKVSIETVPALPQQAAQQLFTLHEQHWPDGVSSFLASSGRRIHEELICRWLPTGRVMMPIVSVDHAPAGIIYAFSFKGEMLIYQMGWDKRYASMSMGNMSVRAAVMEAIQRGLTMADFLPGEYRYKRDWSSRVRVVSDLECLHRWHPRALLFRLGRWVKRRLKAATANNCTADAAVPESKDPNPESSHA